MKQLFLLGCMAMLTLTACGPRDESTPAQGTRPVGDAGGTDQVFGTNAVNDPAGATTGPGAETNTQPNR